MSIYLGPCFRIIKLNITACDSFDYHFRPGIWANILGLTHSNGYHKRCHMSVQAVACDSSSHFVYQGKTPKIFFHSGQIYLFIDKKSVLSMIRPNKLTIVG